MCDPILATLLKMRPFIVNPVVKMRPHPAAHPQQPLIREYPPPRAFTPKIYLANHAKQKFKEPNLGRNVISSDWFTLDKHIKMQII